MNHPAVEAARAAAVAEGTAEAQRAERDRFFKLAALDPNTEVSPRLARAIESGMSAEDFALKYLVGQAGGNRGAGFATRFRSSAPGHSGRQANSA